MTGVSVVTFLAMLGGFAVYSLQQLIAARRNQAGLTVRAYFTEHWPESAVASICGAVMYLGLPEFVAAYPDVARAVGAASSGRSSPISSAVA
jgi:hypothetical protein